MSIRTIKSATSWDNIFMLEALLWSRKSHDKETKCGCVIVKDKTCLSTGYNGFVRDVQDDQLPTTRPEKYPYMIHAEANAIYNCGRLGKSVIDSTAYITGKPCQNCLQMMYQCGISQILFSDLSTPKCVTEDKTYLEILNLVSKKIDIYFLPAKNIDYAFMRECLEIAAEKI